MLSSQILYDLSLDVRFIFVFQISFKTKLDIWDRWDDSGEDVRAQHVGLVQ